VVDVHKLLGVFHLNDYVAGLGGEPLSSPQPQPGVVTGPPAVVIDVESELRGLKKSGQ
jgi:hypothetical protein